MSRWIVLIVAVLLATLAAGGPLTAGGPGLSAAQEASPAATDCPGTTEEENEALARRFAEERYSNPASLDELLAPDVVYHRSSSTGIQTAAEAQARAAEFNVAFPDVRVTVEYVTAKDDSAAVAWVAEGTHLGEFDGIAATGRRATWEGLSILRFACGRIVEGWNQTDTLGLREQLGIVTAEELADAEPSGAATPAP